MQGDSKKGGDQKEVYGENSIPEVGKEDEKRKEGSYARVDRRRVTEGGGHQSEKRSSTS